MQQKPAPTPETFHPADISDVIVRPLRKFDDRRGWLTELFGHDELPAEFFPVMSYCLFNEASQGGLVSHP